MKPPYANELASLSATYEAARTGAIPGLEAGVRALASGPAAYVGSGGSMVLASLASRLHEVCFAQAAYRATALELLQMPHLARRGALLFSSSAKHPDAQLVLKEFARGRFDPAVVWTHRDAESVRERSGPASIVQSLPALPHPDGFIATNSILQGAVLLVRAFLGNYDLPVSLPDHQEHHSVRREVIVLTSPQLVPVATDIEVRLVESGLCAVQVSDYRNFAHGRHTGFSRRLQDTTVIALSDVSSSQLAEATVRQLPKESDVRLWSTGQDWPRSVLELLVRSMRLAHIVGQDAGVDIARPKVPDFGRRLYNLPIATRTSASLATGAARKAASIRECGEPVTDDYVAQAGRDWLADVSKRSFRGLVLDYDGTVCWTSRRLDLPTDNIQSALIRLARDGLIIGFASGRGGSLHADLRKWFPAELWDRVRVGFYNGAVVRSLNEEVGDWRLATTWSSAVVQAIRTDRLFDHFVISERAVQVTLEGDASVEGGRISPERIRLHLRQAGVEAKVVSSGHSLDIIDPSTSKVNVVRNVGALAGGDCLVIGDQGQRDGNDYEMLSSSPWTLTVDRSSGDLSSCWFAGRGDQYGPDLLHQYLTALRPSKGGHTLKGLRLE